MDWLNDDPVVTEEYQCSPWHVAIVDDDPEVHKVTELTLKNFEFEGRKVKFVNAYSGKEAIKLFEQRDDIAMVLLDVVMESDNAGLTVVKHLREKLNNHYTRVIIRTGQPGSAPEDEVIRNYDIDGYKSKTNVTPHDLNLTFLTALRSYRDVVSIQHYQRGLEAIVNSMQVMAEMNTIEEFTQALMTQLANVLNSNQTEFIMQDSEALTLSHNERNRWHILANQVQSQSIVNEVDSDPVLTELANKALSQKQSIFEPPLYAHYYNSKHGVESVFILRNSQKLCDFNRHLLEIFSHNAVSTLVHLVRPENKLN